MASFESTVWSTPGLRNQAADMMIYSLSMASVMHLTSLLTLDSALESELIEQQISQKIHNLISIWQKLDCFRHCESEIEARDFRYRLCCVTIVVWSGIQLFADRFLDCTELPHNYFSGQSGFHWLLDMCYCVLRAETSTGLPKEDISNLNNGARKFLHHYELFRRSLLDVHILEARGPTKSNIKYKWDLYELIFIYSLLLHFV